MTWIAFGMTALSILAGAAIMAFVVWRGHLPVQLGLNTFQIPVIHFDNVVVLLVISILLLASIVRWRNVSKQRSGPEEHQTPEKREESEKSLTLRAMFYLAFLTHIVAVAGIVWLAYQGWTSAVQLPPVAAWLLEWPIHLLRLLFGADWGGRAGGYVQRLLTSSFWLWPFLSLISAVVRNFLVQYVGDVTAYISSNKIDRFDQIRKKIKDAAKESAGAVYLAKAVGSNDFEYKKLPSSGTLLVPLSPTTRSTA